MAAAKEDNRAGVLSAKYEFLGCNVMSLNSILFFAKYTINHF
jgi:hypothetical protein